MAYIDQYALSDDLVFRKRCEQAAISSAKDVAAEDPGTPNHANRAALSKAILNDPTHYAAIFAKAVASNGAVSGNSIDSDLQFTANSLFNAVAGVI